MNVIVVDDEPLAVDRAIMLLKEIPQIEEIKGFMSSDSAIDYVRKNHVDIAFLDIEMYDMNGIELAKNIKLISPSLSIIFLTGYSSYAVEAFSLHVHGFLLKPVTREDLKREILSVSETTITHQSGKVWIQCFGSFEVFLNGKKISFSRAKTKEFLAILVDRMGSSVSTSEAVSILWEGKPYDASTKSMFHNLTTDLRQTLKSLGLEDIIDTKRNSYAIKVSSVDCDYYRFLSGDVQGLNSFHGDYMTNYSWAEPTAGLLSR